MKDYIKTLLIVFICFAGCSGCSRMVYVPVESVKAEYKDNYVRDSIHVRDSVFLLLKGDTVYKEKYSIIYRDKLIRDSVFVCDTIRVPYEVIKTVEKKQGFISRIRNSMGMIFTYLIAFIIGYFLYKIR